MLHDGCPVAGPNSCFQTIICLSLFRFCFVFGITKFGLLRLAVLATTLESSNVLIICFVSTMLCIFMICLDFYSLEFPPAFDFNKLTL